MLFLPESSCVKRSALESRQQLLPLRFSLVQVSDAFWL